MEDRDADGPLKPLHHSRTKQKLMATASNNIRNKAEQNHNTKKKK
jgi:hypothetical protein